MKLKEPGTITEQPETTRKFFWDYNADISQADEPIQRQPYEQRIWGEDKIIAQCTFANIVEVTYAAKDFTAGNILSTQKRIMAEDGADGGLDLSDENRLELFKRLDVDTDAFIDYEASTAAVGLIVEALPRGRIAEAFLIAMNARIEKLLMRWRDQSLIGGSSSEELRRIKHARTDLLNMLDGIAAALHLNSPNLVHANDFRHGFDNTHVWYGRGAKTRNSGFAATYSVCSDTFHADGDDHAEQLGELDDELTQWPDEFHSPAMLEVRVDPATRIEFAYTPEIETAKQRHHSHAEVADGAAVRMYDNQSLSIRLDIDPKAPCGMALDLGRSSYDGGDGRHITRNADLLGGVFEGITADGSHEYAGFEEGMASEFRNFAEHLAVQLSLQKKEIESCRARRDLAVGALKLAG